jgi:hypothetical protein
VVDALRVTDGRREPLRNKKSAELLGARRRKLFGLIEAQRGKF